MIKYLINRIDHRGNKPVKTFDYLEDAEFFMEDCIETWRVISEKEHPDTHLFILQFLDPGAEYCKRGIKYHIEKIISE